ncbi:MAG TPA: hypothetical protein VIL09_13400 [Microvirga sp.]|jgi:hypothetical protein
MTKAKAKSKKDTGLPKKVAGVKVPKAVRESKSLGTMLSSGLGREILADALIAAAGAAAAALTKTRAAQNTGRAVADMGSAGTSLASDVVQTAAGAVASVVTDAARNFLPPALVGGEEPEGKPRTMHRSADHSSRKQSDKGEGKKTAKKSAPKKGKKADKA